MRSSAASVVYKRRGSADNMERCVQGRVAVPPTLPLDVERTKTVLSGPSGSADHAGLHAQARVAVPPTLPNGIERTEAVRSGPSGSAIGTLRPEWQCISHCHSMVNVRSRNVQGRVAVRARATPP